MTEQGVAGGGKGEAGGADEAEGRRVLDVEATKRVARVAMWRCVREKRRDVALRTGKEKRCGAAKGKREEMWRCEREKRRNVAMRRGKKKYGAAKGKREEMWRCEGEKRRNVALRTGKEGSVVMWKSPNLSQE